MLENEFFMQRCFDLAKLGLGAASPNPCVGAVLVYNDRIIGEGYHKKHGQAHAEVHALASVKAADRHLIPGSTLFVSLEPCCIYGHTPPCTSLIIENRIPKVVIASTDHTPGVNGRGIELLRQAGIEVVTGVLQQAGDRLSAPRNMFVSQQRPYIILKYAKTLDGFIARTDNQQEWITSDYTKRLVHKWRSETDAILVGTRTAEVDNPALTTRHYFGKSPLRIVLDRFQTLTPNLALFDGKAHTLVVTASEPPQPIDGVDYFVIEDWDALLPRLLHHLYLRKIGILLVEGGPTLLSSFISANLWDEARVLTGAVSWPKGLHAPTLPCDPKNEYKLESDNINIYLNT
ncbi:MAG: bifunctional diaminohydroxyphosphoribosylaminopyrimidine deaminase/5-amino-6-(5-phosphoribosylamino)uracil reductase RibD [Saprospiraceae bacterium]|nr:bifunctional diaminohydroxyphosphoribosylaminopyrimidine deaminase/5-amino-6-(5-phosphoribosylamino)uracil reductase RibD [Saprospiraceae bacterium]